MWLKILRLMHVGQLFRGTILYSGPDDLMSEAITPRAAGPIHSPNRFCYEQLLQGGVLAAAQPEIFLALVQLVLADDRFTIDISCNSMSGSEHRSPRRHDRREAHEPDGFCDVIINRFHSAPH